ncbi:hypothetical protein AYO47_07900 [Planctomyces sp. SCGC AG-212-M04]|nr:hypothetical protein AYO47_07900 [Planctomyces sp. SCGC AG-212-M04]
MENDETGMKTINEWKAGIVLELTSVDAGTGGNSTGKPEARASDNDVVIARTSPARKRGQKPGFFRAKPFDQPRSHQRFHKKRQNASRSVMLLPRVTRQVTTGRKTRNGEDQRCGQLF